MMGNATTEGGVAINGNVLTNDAVGADQPGTVIGITGGTIGAPIVTAFGTLTLNGNGTYSYTPKASVPSGTVDSFTYTMKDADGDTSTAVLSFTFSGDNNHATAGTAATLVDEDDLAAGNHDAASGDDAPTAQPGTLTHNYGLDGARLDHAGKRQRDGQWRELYLHGERGRDDPDGERRGAERLPGEPDRCGCRHLHGDAAGAGEASGHDARV